MQPFVFVDAAELKDDGTYEALSVAWFIDGGTVKGRSLFSSDGCTAEAECANPRRQHPQGSRDRDDGGRGDGSYGTRQLVAPELAADRRLRRREHARLLDEARVPVRTRRGDARERARKHERRHTLRVREGEALRQRFDAICRKLG